MLGKKHINPVVKRKIGALKACATKDPNLKGTVMVMMVIQRNGSVSSVNASTKRLRKSPQKGCILQIMKSLKFSAFNGDPQRVPYPLTF